MKTRGSKSPRVFGQSLTSRCSEPVRHACAPNAPAPAGDPFFAHDGFYNRHRKSWRGGRVILARSAPAVLPHARSRAPARKTLTTRPESSSRPIASARPRKYSRPWLHRQCTFGWRDRDLRILPKRRVMVLWATALAPTRSRTRARSDDTISVPIRRRDRPRSWSFPTSARITARRTRFCAHTDPTHSIGHTIPAAVHPTVVNPAGTSRASILASRSAARWLLHPILRHGPTGGSFFPTRRAVPSTSPSWSTL